MDYVLAELLSEVPDNVFYNEMGDPNFNAIFLEVMKKIYHERDDNFTIPSRDFISNKLPNLSTFQRSVTNERKRRSRYSRK